MLLRKRECEQYREKIFMIRDGKMEFHDGPAKAEMRVCWNDDFRKTTTCQVDPQTHEVYGFDEDPFKRPDPQDRAWKVSGFDDDLFNRELSDQNIEIKRIIVYTATSVNDYYFECEKMVTVLLVKNTGTAHAIKHNFKFLGGAHPTTPIEVEMLKWETMPIFTMLVIILFKLNIVGQVMSELTPIKDETTEVGSNDNRKLPIKND